MKSSISRGGSPSRIHRKKSRTTRNDDVDNTARKMRSPPIHKIARARTMAPAAKGRWTPSPIKSRSPQLRVKKVTDKKESGRRRAMTFVAKNKRRESPPSRNHSSSEATPSPPRKSDIRREAEVPSHSLRAKSTFNRKSPSPTPKPSKVNAITTPENSQQRQSILSLRKNIEFLKAKIEKKKKQDKSKKRQLSGDGTPRIHPDNDKFEPPNRYGATKAGHIHCQICQSYFLDDLESANQHIALHKEVTFCAKVPEDQWFFNIEDVVAHLAANKFKKQEVREKILKMNLVEYPENVKGFGCQVCRVNFSKYSNFVTHVRSEKCAAQGNEESVCIVWCRACHTRFVSVVDLKLHIQQENKKCFLSDQILNEVYARPSTKQNSIKQEIVFQNYVQDVVHQPIQLSAYPDMPGHLPNHLLPLPHSQGSSPPLSHMRHQADAAASSAQFDMLNSHFKIALPLSDSSRLSTPPARPDPKMSLACSPPRIDEQFNVYADLHTPAGNYNAYHHQPYLYNDNLQQILQSVSSSINEGLPKQPTFRTNNQVRLEAVDDDNELPVFGKKLPVSQDGGRYVVRTVYEDAAVAESNQTLSPRQPSISKPEDKDCDDDIKVIELLSDSERCERNLCYWNGPHVDDCSKLVISKRCGEGRCKPTDLHQSWGFKFNKFAKKAYGTGGHICPKLQCVAIRRRPDPRLRKRYKETPVIPHLNLRPNIKTEHPLPQCENPDPRLRKRCYPRPAIKYPEKFQYRRKGFILASWNSRKANDVFLLRRKPKFNG